MRRNRVLAILVLLILALSATTLATPGSVEEMTKADFWAMLLVVRGDAVETQLRKVREAMFENATHDIPAILKALDDAVANLGDPATYQIEVLDYPADEREFYQAFLDYAKEEYRRAAVMIQILAQMMAMEPDILAQVALQELAQVHCDTASWTLWQLGQAQRRDK